MFIIPAIDLKEGQCVRLVQGSPDEKTVYNLDPAEVAINYWKAGASRIHVVDLDGAFSGVRKNLEAVKTIIQSVDIPVQFGGGVRNMDVIREMLGLGVERVIVGTAAVTEPHLMDEACAAYPGRIVAGADVSGDKIAIKGWQEKSSLTASDFVESMQKKGVKLFVFTDISRDGMLQGPNYSAIDDFLKLTGGGVIASGGVGRIDDVHKLTERVECGLEGVIVGKALYDGRISLDELI